MLTIWRNAAKQKFDQLSASDQRAVLIMLAAIISAVVYLSLSLSSGYQKSAVSRYERALQDSRWLDTNQAKLL